jgi:AraC-like DNA-binding protein
MDGIDKLSRIPPYIRRRIVALSESGLNNCKIRDTLIREDNVQISRPGISLFLKRYNATGVIDDQNRRNCANERKKLRDEHLRFIDDTMSDDREKSASEVSRVVRQRFGITVSDSTIKRARQKLGWKRRAVKYCQQVRIANKPKRLEFAVRCVTTNEQFQDVVFTDETTVKIQNSINYSFWKDGEEIRQRPKPKHPYQVCA